MMSWTQLPELVEGYLIKVGAHFLKRPRQQ